MPPKILCFDHRRNIFGIFSQLRKDIRDLYAERPIRILWDLLYGGTNVWGIHLVWDWTLWKQCVGLVLVRFLWIVLCLKIYRIQHQGHSLKKFSCVFYRMRYHILNLSFIVFVEVFYHCFSSLFQTNDRLDVKLNMRLLIMFYIGFILLRFMIWPIFCSKIYHVQKQEHNFMKIARAFYRMRYHVLNLSFFVGGAFYFYWLSIIRNELGLGLSVVVFAVPLSVFYPDLIGDSLLVVGMALAGGHPPLAYYFCFFILYAVIPTFFQLRLLYCKKLFPLKIL